MLFIDNPIGTGFSVAAKVEDIPLDQSTVADHLYHALEVLFRKASLKGRPLFLTGESYAGKYVPALACKILDTIKEAVAMQAAPFEFRGVAIGNGFTDPRTQVRIRNPALKGQCRKSELPIRWSAVHYLLTARLRGTRRLGGRVAVLGNGGLQVQVHAEVMTSFGLLDEQQAAYVDRVAQEVVDLVDRYPRLRATPASPSPLSLEPS